MKIHLKKTLLCGLAFFSSLANASLYLKVYSGNTFNNQNYVSKTPWISGGALFALTETSMTNYSNLFTSGAGLGYNTEIYNKVKLGLELESFTQIPDVKFYEHIDSANTSPVGGILAEIESRNDYNARLSAVVTLGDLFYIKAGPSYMREKFKTSLSDPANVKKFVYHNAENFLGASGGLGFNYKLSEVFSIFSEYNYTYYSKEKLPDITLPVALLETPNAGNGDDSYYRDRAFRYTNSTFFLGIQANIV